MITKYFPIKALLHLSVWGDKNGFEVSMEQAQAQHVRVGGHLGVVYRASEVSQPQACQHALMNHLLSTGTHKGDRDSNRSWPRPGDSVCGTMQAYLLGHFHGMTGEG